VDAYLASSIASHGGALLLIFFPRPFDPPAWYVLLRNNRQIHAGNQ
jgi:hypothetical protein